MLRRPEGLGVVCALVYLLTVIIFIPFPFYKDIVAATSNQDSNSHQRVVDSQDPMSIVEGRMLHRFPHSKVGKVEA